MSVADLFSVCFVFGFVLSVVPFLAGSLHLGHLHTHVPHGHVHVKGAGSRVNFGTLAAFLVWFGGTGYILINFTVVQLALVLLGAIVAGLAGAITIYLFITRVLTRNDVALDPDDYRMTGLLGTVCSPVVHSGTGEMIALQQGRRVGVPIRSETGESIESGKEVIVTRYEHGIAFVREWDELAGFES